MKKEQLKVQVKAPAKDDAKDQTKEKPKDGMAQYTRFEYLHDSVDVAGGACVSPYHCRKCSHYESRVHMNPEVGDRTYRAHSCSRPDHPKRISVHEWYRRETERIMAQPGRRVELREGSKEKEGKRGKFAMFVDDRSKNAKVAKVVNE